jgi:dihydroflavonol-4-reductase
VRDVAEGTISALERGQRGGHYILAGHNVPYFDLWQQMAKVSGGKGPIMRDGPLLRIIGGTGGDLWTKLTGREGDINSATVAMGRQLHYYTSAKAERDLGYRIRPLEESLRDAWEWFEERGTV